MPNTPHQTADSQATARPRRRRGAVIFLLILGVGIGLWIHSRPPKPMPGPWPEARALLPVEVDGHWGVVDTDGDWVIKPRPGDLRGMGTPYPGTGHHRLRVYDCEDGKPRVASITSPTVHSLEYVMQVNVWRFRARWPWLKKVTEPRKLVFDTAGTLRLTTAALDNPNSVYSTDGTSYLLTADELKVLPVATVAAVAENGVIYGHFSDTTAINETTTFRVYWPDGTYLGESNRIWSELPLADVAILSDGSEHRVIRRDGSIVIQGRLARPNWLGDQLLDWWGMERILCDPVSGRSVVLGPNQDYPVPVWRGEQHESEMAGIMVWGQTHLQFYNRDLDQIWERQSVKWESRSGYTTSDDTLYIWVLKHDVTHMTSSTIILDETGREVNRIPGRIAAFESWPYVVVTERPARDQSTGGDGVLHALTGEWLIAPQDDRSVDEIEPQCWRVRDVTAGTTGLWVRDGWAIPPREASPYASFRIAKRRGGVHKPPVFLFYVINFRALPYAEILREGGETIASWANWRMSEYSDDHCVLVYQPISNQERDPITGGQTRIFDLHAEALWPETFSHVRMLTDDIFYVEQTDGRRGYRRRDRSWIWEWP